MAPILEYTTYKIKYIWLKKQNWNYQFYVVATACSSQRPHNARFKVWSLFWGTTVLCIIQSNKQKISQFTATQSTQNDPILPVRRSRNQRKVQIMTETSVRPLWAASRRFLLYLYHSWGKLVPLALRFK